MARPSSYGGMTYRAIARELGISKSMVVQIERDIFRKIVVGLGYECPEQLKRKRYAKKKRQ